MLRSDTRFDPKRKRVDHKKTQFATATYQDQEYPHRLSFYDVPPTQEISLEEFETWAIDRLRSTASLGCAGQFLTCVQFWPNWKLARSETSLLKRLPLTLNPY